MVSEQRSKIKNARGNPPPRGLAHCNTHQVSPGILLSPRETHSVVSDLLQPQALYSPWNSPWQNTGVEYLPNPGIKPRSPALHADSLAAGPQGKPFSVQSRYLIKALWNGALLLGSEAGEFCPWSEFKAREPILELVCVIPRSYSLEHSKPQMKFTGLTTLCPTHTPASWTAPSLCCRCAQSCPSLCDPIDCRPPGSSVRGISQASILEWVTMSPSRGPS